MMLDGVVRVVVEDGRGVRIRVILGVLPAFFTTGLYVLLFLKLIFGCIYKIQRIAHKIK